MSNRLLDMLQTKYPEYHPLMAICDIAHHMEADLRLQFDSHKEIAKYVEATQKAIEFKGREGETLPGIRIIIEDDYGSTLDGE